MSNLTRTGTTIHSSLLARSARLVALAGLALAAPPGCDGEGEPTGIDAERDGSETPAPGGSLAAPPGRFCVVDAQEGEPTEAALAAESEVACFSRFSEAIFFAVGEELPDDATPESYTPGPLRAGAEPAAGESHIIGIEYEHKNFGGLHLMIRATTPCSHSNKWVNLKSEWQDRIDSATAWAGCNKSYHYENLNWTGAQINCGQACSYVGDALHDRISSIRWTQ